MICGLDLIGQEYRAMTTRARMAEDHAAEIKDLLCALFAEQHPGAQTFLRELAADWADEFVKRRAEGKAAA